MKTNKNLLKISVFLVCILLLTVTAEAQRRRTTTKKTTQTTTNQTTSQTTNAVEIKDGANKVAIQIKNVSKFIYVLGTVAQSIEMIDKDTRATQADRDKNAQNKQSVIQAIRNLQAGLAALEIDFRTKNSLKPYNTNIQGVADLCGQAEALAASGKFLESGKPLLLIVEKLSDTLVAMP